MEFLIAGKGEGKSLFKDNYVGPNKLIQQK